MSISAELRGLERVLNLFGRTPPHVTRALRASTSKVGQRFLNFHKKKRLSAKRVTSGLGPLRGTKKGFVGLRRFKTEGRTLNSLKLRVTLAGPPVDFETGVTRTTGGTFLIPTKAARSKHTGKVLKRFLNQAKRRKLILIRSKGVAMLAKVNKKQPRSSKERLTILFFLKRSVQVQPRLQFYATWREFRPKAMRLFANSLRFALRATRRGAPQAKIKTPNEGDR